MIGASLHARGRRPVARRLTKLGVTVLEGPRARVTEVTRDGVRLDDGRELPSAVTIWTRDSVSRTWPPAAGCAPTPKAAWSPTRR